MMHSIPRREILPAPRVRIERAARYWITRFRRRNTTVASAGSPTTFSARSDRYQVEGSLAAPDGRRPLVRTIWQMDEGQLAPRLITAYPRSS